MGQPAKRRATYDDLIAVPEHLIAEIIDGELVTQPRPAPPHAEASSNLGRVSHLWLIDPIVKTLEVFRLVGEAWHVVGSWEGGAIVNAEPFETHDLALANLWQI